MQHDILKAFGAYMPRLGGQAGALQGERPIFDLFNIEDEIARALARRVDLKSGGYLIIDQTEALTTIDVNTGGFVGARNFDDTIFKTNLEAAGIARQLRCATSAASSSSTSSTWRETHQQAVLAELRKQLARDRTRHHGQRLHAARPGGDDAQTHARESLAHMLCEPCPHLRGAKGQVKTARSVCYDILREILRGRASSTRGSASSPPPPWWRCCSTRRASTWPACRSSSASRSRCRPSRR